MNEKIRKAIYDKYIAPTTKERPDYIGVEIEMPFYNHNQHLFIFLMAHIIQEVFMLFSSTSSCFPHPLCTNEN